MYNKEFEAMPVEKLKELQTERMKWSLEHAYKNNKFYRDSFDKAKFNPAQFKSLDDLKRVPFLTKEDMREKYPYGLFATSMDDVVRIHASSGTTGNATVVGYTRTDVDVWAESAARALVAYGVTPSDIIQVAYGYGLFTGGLGLHYGSEKLGAVTIPISGGNTERQLTMIRDLGSTVIACTPSYILNVADHMQKMGSNFDIKKTKLRIGVFGAEPWSESMRKEIESRMNMQAFDIYGLSEIIGPGVSYECSQKSGLHVNEDHFYVEIIDPETGEVLPEGSEGEIVYTSLTKEACPSIRYRSRDITKLYRDSCKCGRTFIKMDKVYGRSDDMLIIRGVNVYPAQIESVLMSIEGTEPHYLIIVDRIGALDEIEVKVEVNEKLFSDKLKMLDSLRKTITDKFKGILGISAKITFVEPGSIPRSEGKAKRVIDNRKI